MPPILFGLCFLIVNASISSVWQASYYLQHQIQYVTQLDDTDRQIRTEKTSSDLLKRLKEARAVYREDLIECVRQSTW